MVANLSLAGAQTTFKMGEPVRLVMSFSGTPWRYQLSSVPYPWGGAPRQDPDHARGQRGEITLAVHFQSSGATRVVSRKLPPAERELSH